METRMRPRKLGRGNPEDQTLLQAGDFPRHVPCVNIAGLGRFDWPLIYLFFSLSLSRPTSSFLALGMEPKQCKH